MACTHCNSENVRIKDVNRRRWYCRDCGKTYTVPAEGDPPKPSKAKIGMTLNEFRDKHDIEHIVDKTLKKLRPDLIYEKNDIVKLAALNYSAPGLGTVLESKSEYYGKAGSKIYYSHPDTIKELKEQAKLM